MIQLANIFQNGMVLQRGREIPVWGTAAPGRLVWVDLGGGSVATTSGADGRWLLKLPPHPAAEDRTLTVRCEGEDRLSVHDVAVGEVWIAAGQSNMEFPLFCDAEYLRAAASQAHEEIRFFDVPRREYPGQETGRDFSSYGIWRKDDAKGRPWFSAVGWYFARQLARSLQVPIGVIGCNFGSTPAAAWIPAETIRQTPALSPLWEEYCHAISALDMEAYEAFVRRRDQALDAPDARRFTERVYREHLTKAEMEAMRQALDPALFEKCIGPKYFKRPGGLYETMVSTLIPYGVKGALWYQGESDDYHAPLYTSLLTALITSWRRSWRQPLPFLVVQLADFESWNGVDGSRFPQMRKAQQEAAQSLPGVSLIDSSGAGDPIDIHPKYKRLIGERLAETAVNQIYTKS